MSVRNRLFLISACRSMLRLASAPMVRGDDLSASLILRSETE
jgi:hypothetical protein